MDQALPPLCKICDTAPPKYECPRCSSKTCSLVCYQRHQKLYDCTGKRDPTAKLSRSELANPTAFDRDYNFLTSLERAVESSDRHVDDIEAVAPRLPAKDSPMDLALQECGIRILRVPVAMTRHRQNNTHWMHKRKQIQWTVEWIHPDGSSEIGSCSSRTLPISAYLSHLAGGGATAPSAKRRKLSMDNIPVTQSVRNAQSVPDLAAPTHHARDVGPASSSGTVTANASSNRSGSTDVPVPTSGESPPSPSKFHLYLVKPLTKGKEKVLIPLPPKKSIYDCLRWQEVIEFPTIQVLEKRANELPPGFVLERDYSQDGHGLVQEVEASVQHIPENGNRKSPSLEPEEELNPARVLEFLKKDIAQLTA